MPLPGIEGGFRGEAAMEEVKALVAIGPRAAGTDGAEKAANHLSDRLKALNLIPSIDIFSEETPSGTLILRNVSAEIPGDNDQLVVLVSHFDTKSGLGDAFVGANDSGSSSGVLLEMARVLAAAPSRPFTFLVAFVDGEECRQAYGPKDGLHGSRRLAQQLARTGRSAKVKAVFVIDMVGDRDLTVTIPRNGSPELVDRIFTAAHELGVREKFGLHTRNVTDDHVPFLESAIPAIDIIDFAYGPTEATYWHTPADTVDKLSAESLETVGRVVLRAAWSLPTR
jgi:glutaminyl-peptide cyclotransferase